MTRPAPIHGRRPRDRDQPALPPYIHPVDDKRTVSVMPIGLALDPHLSPAAKGMASVLGAYMNPDWICHPSQHALARDLGCHRHTVAKFLRELEARGWLAIELRSGRAQAEKRTSRYQWRNPVTGRPMRAQAPEQFTVLGLTVARGGKSVSKGVDTRVENGGVGRVDAASTYNESLTALNEGGRIRALQNRSRAGTGERSLVDVLQSPEILAIRNTLRRAAGLADELPPEQLRLDDDR